MRGAAALAPATLALAAAWGGPAHAGCVRIAHLWSPAVFARYPAATVKGPWRQPDVRRGEPHRFRTMVRLLGQGEPDFAGRYKVAKIGCGAGAACPAFVDRASGKVAFPPALRVLGILPVDLGASKTLTYRRDSRLLVLVGMRNEDERTAGASLFEWRGNRPHLIRFVPHRQLCVEEAPTA
jgi:hypothetical protein